MSTDAEFAQFWQAFPRKVGKLEARKRFEKARTQASLPELLDGIARYVKGKPQYADFCHPSTWLSQGRWMDEYEGASPTLAHEPHGIAAWVYECAERHGSSCQNSQQHANRMGRRGQGGIDGR